MSGTQEQQERTSSFTAFYGTLICRVTGRNESIRQVTETIAEKTIFLNCVYDVPVRQPNGNYGLESHWVDVIVPHFLAKRLDQYLIKGKFLTVNGTIRMGHYVGKVVDPNGICCPTCNSRLAVEMNVKKLKVEILANDIRLLPGSKATTSTDGQPLGVTNVTTMQATGQPVAQGGQVQQFPVNNVNTQYIAQSSIESGTQNPLVTAGANVNIDDIPF